jgi:hypothetical protein
MVPIWLCEIKSLTARGSVSVVDSTIRAEVLTVSSVALHNAAHTHGGRSLKKGAGDNGIGPRHRVATASNGQDTIMYTLYYLADASLDAGLVSEVCNVLSALSNDDASFLGRDNGAQRQLGLGILLVRLRGGLAIRSQPIVHLKVIQAVDELVAVGRVVVLRGRHDELGFVKALG